MRLRASILGIVSITFLTMLPSIAKAQTNIFCATNLPCPVLAPTTLPTGATPQITAISLPSAWITANSAPTTVTNILGGFNGQTIELVHGAGDNTSISSGTYFALSSPWNSSTSTPAILLTLVGTVWTEIGRAGGGGGGGGVPITTVAGLPSVPGLTKGSLAVVTNGSTATDCATGGGSNVVTCQYNGTSWSQLAAASSGSTAFSALTPGTNTGTGFSVAPTATGTVPWTHNCPAGITVDCFDWELNAVKQMWLDSAGLLHLNQSPAFSITGNSAGFTGNLSGDVTGTQGTTVVSQAAKWTSSRNLAGNAVNGTANVPFSNAFIVGGTADAGLSGAQFLGALGTGVVKVTTTTGVLSDAAGSDINALIQSLTGCGTATFVYTPQASDCVAPGGGGGGISLTGTNANPSFQSSSTSLATTANNFNCDFYSGATPDIKINAGWAAALAAGGIADCRDFIGTQTFASGASLIAGNSSSNPAFYDFPNSGTWLVNPNSNSTYNLVVNSGTTLKGDGASNTFQIKGTGTGTSAGGLLVQKGTAGFYNDIENLSFVQSGGNLGAATNTNNECNVHYLVDNSILRNILCFDSGNDNYVFQVAPGTTDSVCCGGLMEDITINANGSHAGAFDEEGTTNAFSAWGNTICNISAGQPGSGKYNMLFNDTSGSNQHMATFICGTDYMEDNHTSNTATAFIHINGANSLHFSQVNPVLEFTTTKNIIETTNLYNTNLAVDNGHIYSEAGSSTYPLPFVVNAFTGHTANTDSLGNFGMYRSAPSYFENLTAWNLTLGGFATGCLTSTSGVISSTGSACGGSGGFTPQVNSTNLAGGAGLNLETSTTNANGITLTPVNSSGVIVKEEATVPGTLTVPSVAITGPCTGGGTAGCDISTAGTAPTATANARTLYAPSSIPTGYTEAFPGSIVTGVMHCVVTSTNCVDSWSAVTPADATGNTSGSGNFVLVTSPTLVTPALGTPSALILTNATALPAAIANTAVQGLTGCSTSGNVYTPAGSDCVAPGGGGSGGANINSGGIVRSIFAGRSGVYSTLGEIVTETTAGGSIGDGAATTTTPTFNDFTISVAFTAACATGCVGFDSSNLYVTGVSGTVYQFQESFPTNIGTNTGRYYAGICGSGGACTVTVLTRTDSPSSNGLVFVGIRYSTIAGDASPQCVTSDGTTTHVYTTTGVTASAFNKFEIDDNGTSFTIKNNGTAISGCSNMATNIPASGTSVHFVTSETPNTANPIHLSFFAYQESPQ